MKEKIYTIPITDALKNEEVCPFCALKEKLLTETIEYTVGPSYMEDDIRSVSDDLGFCNTHFKMLLDEQNKLGVALISHTHIKNLISNIEQLYKTGAVPKKTLFSRNSELETDETVKYINKTSKSCFVCDKINTTFSRYLENFYHLFVNDDNIKRLLINSKGVCYSHLSQILTDSSSKMKQKDFLELKKILIEKELKNLKILEEDLDFFIKKFDYKNKDLPWGDKRDVLDRVLGYLK